VFPELFCEVRSEGCNHRHEGLDLGAGSDAATRADDVQALHHRGDRGVVTEFRDLLRDLTNRLMHLPLDALVGRAILGTNRGVEEAVQEAAGTLDPLVLVVATLLERPEKHEVRSEGVGAVLFDDRIGHDHVALRLRHLRAFTDDEAVSAEPREGLLEVDVAEILQHHREEARVEQVQHGVLVATDVGVHR